MPKSRPPHLLHNGGRNLLKKNKEDIELDISIPVAHPPPPANPIMEHPVGDIQPVIGRLARRETCLLAPLADMFLEKPGLQQT